MAIALGTGTHRYSLYLAEVCVCADVLCVSRARAKKEKQLDDSNQQLKTTRQLKTTTVPNTKHYEITQLRNFRSYLFACVCVHTRNDLRSVYIFLLPTAVEQKTLAKIKSAITFCLATSCFGLCFTYFSGEPTKFGWAVPAIIMLTFVLLSVRRSPRKAICYSPDI